MCVDGSNRSFVTYVLLEAVQFHVQLLCVGQSFPQAALGVHQSLSMFDDVSTIFGSPEQCNLGLKNFHLSLDFHY